MPDLRNDFAAFARRLDLKHFAPAELLHRVGAQRGSACNSFPPRRLWPNLVPAALVLDALRASLGAPVIFTSGYRDADYNAAVGGGARSQHLAFRAFDFYCATPDGRPVGTPEDWGRLLRDWRGRPFVSPVPLSEGSFGGMTPGGAPFYSEGLRINRTAQGTAFVFAGGVGVYPQSGYVHVDGRGRNASWRGT